MQYEIKTPPLFIGEGDSDVSALSVKHNGNRQKQLRQYICLNFCSTNEIQLQVLLITKGYILSKGGILPNPLSDKLVDDSSKT